MDLLVVFLFALALSLDSLGAGIAYGARQIKVPALSFLIISLISMAAISVSMLGGKAIAAFIPVDLARRMGGLLLLLIGSWVLWQNRRNVRQAENSGPQNVRRETGPENNGPARMFEIHIRPLGLAIQILREPARADLDRSGVISPGEAALLGTALAMDAFCAGFAVSMLGFRIAITPLAVGLGQFIMIYLGIMAGRTITSSRLGRQLTVLPGFILILLGILKIRL